MEDSKKEATRQEEAALERVLQELRDVRKELADIQAELARAGCDGLTAVGGVKLLARKQHALSEIKRLVSKNVRDPEQVLKALERLLNADT